jgi:hypothetical protein
MLKRKNENEKEKHTLEGFWHTAVYVHACMWYKARPENKKWIINEGVCMQMREKEGSG